MNRKQTGFGLLVLLLGIIIVILIGLSGWLIWRLSQTSGKNSASSTTTSQTTTPAAVDGTAAENLVSTFYQKYTDGNTDRATLIQQYGSAALLADYNNAGSNPEGVGEDPIVCAQAIAASTTVTGHKLNGSGIDVTVNEAFDTPKILTVTVVNQSGLKIDKVSCPSN